MDHLQRSARDLAMREAMKAREDCLRRIRRGGGFFCQALEALGVLLLVVAVGLAYAALVGSLHGAGLLALVAAGGGVLVLGGSSSLFDRKGGQ